MDQVKYQISHEAQIKKKKKLSEFYVTSINSLLHSIDKRIPSFVSVQNSQPN